jgi:hypothetical protein
MVGLASYTIELIGVRAWIADVDRDRQYWRDGETLIHACLDWASNEGFTKTLGHLFETVLHDPKVRYISAHDFRQRHILRALEGLAG